MVNIDNLSKGDEIEYNCSVCSNNKNVTVLSVSDSSFEYRCNNCDNEAVHFE